MENWSYFKYIPKIVNSALTYWATEVVSLDFIEPRSTGFGFGLGKARQTE